MKNRLSILFAIAFLSLIACNQSTKQSANQAIEIGEASGGKAEKKLETADENQLAKNVEVQNSTVSANVQSKEPQTVMDFFALLTPKYFTLEGCYLDQDKDCRKARAEYLENFKEIEDIKNGYFKGGCDGAQSCIEMTLFKRPDGTYVVAVATLSEMKEDNYFLDYKHNVWTDVSKQVVPEFSRDNRYEIPRYGTTVRVFSTKLIEKGDDYEIRAKDKKIYDLEWKAGKFARKP